MKAEELTAAGEMLESFSRQHGDVHGALIGQLIALVTLNVVVLDTLRICTRKMERAELIDEALLAEQERLIQKTGEGMAACVASSIRLMACLKRSDAPNEHFAEEAGKFTDKLLERLSRYID